MYFNSLQKVPEKHDVKVARGNVFQEIRPGAGLRPMISLKKGWGSYRGTLLMQEFCLKRVSYILQKRMNGGIRVFLLSRNWDGTNALRGVTH